MSKKRKDADAAAPVRDQTPDRGASADKGARSARASVGVAERPKLGPTRAARTFPDGSRRDVVGGIVHVYAPDWSPGEPPTFTLSPADISRDELRRRHELAEALARLSGEVREAALAGEIARLEAAHRAWIEAEPLRIELKALERPAQGRGRPPRPDRDILAAIVESETEKRPASPGQAPRSERQIVENAADADMAGLPPADQTAKLRDKLAERHRQARRHRTGK